MKKIIDKTAKIKNAFVCERSERASKRALAFVSYFYSLKKRSENVKF